MVRKRTYFAAGVSLFILCVNACVTTMSSADISASPSSAVVKLLPAANRQGIAGSVWSLTGNHMPRPLEKSPSAQAGSQPHSQARRQPVQTNVWIFSGRIPSQGKLRLLVDQAKQHPRFLGQVRSNAKGEFSVGLPPGEYTLLAQYGSNLYLNSFLGDGSYATVKVKPGKITNTQLTNSERATF